MTNSRLLSSCLVSALALAGTAGCADQSRDERNEPEAHVASALQRVLDDAVSGSDQLLPGAITYYREPGETPWSGSAGAADMKAAARMRPADEVRGGSILKTFLATVALQHVEEGTLSLDQTLPELLPSSVTERVKNANRITLRMLLGHTSGIPEWVSPDVEAEVMRDPAHVWSDDEVIDLVAKQPAWFEPGTSWRYSNSNYTLVGMALDRLGEGTWREQLHERVIAPLRLRHTYLPEPGDLDVPGDYAHGYRDVDGRTIDLTRVDSSMAGAAGGHSLLTSVADLAHFLDALLDGKLFTQRETLKAMTTMIDAPSEAGYPHQYGLGLESYELSGGTKVIGHAGTSAGYAVMMFRIPNQDATLVTAVNTGDLFTNALQVFIPSLEVVTGVSGD